jgi:hypothetical protein
MMERPVEFPHGTHCEIEDLLVLISFTSQAAPQSIVALLSCTGCGATSRAEKNPDRDRHLYRLFGTR